MNGNSDLISHQQDGNPATGEPLQLADRRVLVMGLGMSGEAAAVLCSSRGASVTVTDHKEAGELTEVLDRLAQHPIAHRLGADEPDVTGFDLIIRSPGVRSTHSALDTAQKKGIAVWSEVELAARLCPCPIIAVTGTNGKGTTTTLISAMMRADGRRAHLVGNIGIPFAGVLPEIEEDDIVVLEVAAGQLQDSPLLTPTTSVITNIRREHTNLYPWPRYLELKSRIVANHTRFSTTVVSLDDPESCKIAARVPGSVLYVSTLGPLPAGLDGAFIDDDRITARYGGQETVLCRVRDLNAAGAAANTLPAIAVGLSRGLSLTAILHGITSFRGREHVLEYVGEHDGVAYYNDAKATNPWSTQHALREFNGRSVVLIAGGEDNKDGIFTSLHEEFERNVAHLVAFGPTAEHIVNCARGANPPAITVVDDFRTAIEKATQAAEPGQTVIFSPGTYTPHLNPDYIERGHIFKEIITDLIQTS
ncbi:UDP-N-acetylmuramoyl-L-alanine--D-glutamate ligase [Streptomyces sp. NPDC089799]|uniref:UDP-N-acetylmuramoyl-L-alanine--D-glutamate ligase n=1 Tax=Streptomyces sp. NPDC089799 TaxID=3155066 RepID=UPI003423C6D4